MNDYDSLIRSVHAGSVIRFREYNLDRRENKRLVLDIDGAVVHDVVPANRAVAKDLLIRYYGDGLDDTTYLQLSTVNCVRLVLIMSVDEDSNPIYKVIVFNRDFYEMGLQVLEVVNEVNMNEPNYVQSMNQWQF